MTQVLLFFLTLQLTDFFILHTSTLIRHFLSFNTMLGIHTHRHFYTLDHTWNHIIF